MIYKKKHIGTSEQDNKNIIERASNFLLIFYQRRVYDSFRS